MSMHQSSTMCRLFGALKSLYLLFLIIAPHKTSCGHPLPCGKISLQFWSSCLKIQKAGLSPVASKKNEKTRPEWTFKHYSCLPVCSLTPGFSGPRNIGTNVRDQIWTEVVRFQPLGWGQNGQIQTANSDFGPECWVRSFGHVV